MASKGRLSAVHADPARYLALAQTGAHHLQPNEIGAYEKDLHLLVDAELAEEKIISFDEKARTRFKRVSTNAAGMHHFLTFAWTDPVADAAGAADFFTHNCRHDLVRLDR